MRQRLSVERLCSHNRDLKFKAVKYTDLAGNVFGGQQLEIGDVTSLKAHRTTALLTNLPRWESTDFPGS